MAPPDDPLVDDFPPLQAAPTDRHSPTPGGYLAAGALAVLLFAVGFGIAIGAPMVSDDAGQGVTAAVTAGITYGFFAGVCATVAAVVIGLPMSMIAHVALRAVRSQAIHAATFGAVGIVSAAGCLAVFRFLEWQPAAWGMLAGAGISAATGRYLVGRRQGLRTHIR